MKMALEELDGCDLGTKEYWENNYWNEILNYEKHGDVGEIWFNEDSQFRIINWLKTETNINTMVEIIDLGCGNGMFLIELAREGFKNLVGVDFSAKAVQLATSISKAQNLKIKYEEVDIVDVEKCAKLGKFKVIHDKGTYDAICLCPEDPKQKRELYLQSVYNMMDADSLFIITSCNWTESELLISFKNRFIKKCTIPTPSYMFGGKLGNLVTSVVFIKY